MAPLRRAWRSWRRLPWQSRVQLWWTVVTVTVLTAIGGLGARAAGESTRTTRIVQAQADRLERDIRADCQFKLDVAWLPGKSPHPSAALLKLAADAVDAYVGKGCPSATNPRTGRPFGPPPTIPGR